MFALSVAALVTGYGAACVAARVLSVSGPDVVESVPAEGRTRTPSETSSLGERVVASGLLALVLPVLEVRALSPLQGLVPGAMFAAAAVAGGLFAWLAGARARARVLSDLRMVARALRTAGRAWPLVAAGAVSLFAVGAAAWAAYLLDPWAWDALGYHLPIVQDALQQHTLRRVPTHILYVNAYPHAIECFLIACRLLLRDDTLLDFLQAPYALLGCIATAALARRAGASRARAAAYGSLFAAVPIVMLQLATDYIDVAVASLLVTTVYFTTAPLALRGAPGSATKLANARLLFWAIAAGYLLGSKPCAPPAVALLGVVLLARGKRARRVTPALAAAVLALLLGAEKYVENIVRYGNPIWPVRIDVGPVHLLGLHPSAALFVQGLPPELQSASWLQRVLRSIFDGPAAYLYDMHLGGFGPLVPFVLLPVAVLTARRAPRRAWFACGLVAACALATPAAHWTRFSMALVAALLAIVAVSTQHLAPRLRGLVDAAVLFAAVVGVAHALPGLTNNGPSLLAVARMPRNDRMVAVDPFDREDLWSMARSRVGEGESLAYDDGLGQPGRLWKSDGSARTLYVGDAENSSDLARRIEGEQVRIFVTGDDETASQLVRRGPDELRLLFACPTDPCNVYEVLRSSGARVAR